MGGRSCGASANGETVRGLAFLGVGCEPNWWVGGWRTRLRTRGVGVKIFARVVCLRHGCGGGLFCERKRGTRVGSGSV